VSEEQLNKIKKVGFVLRPNSPDIRFLYEKIRAKFEDRGIEVLLGDVSAEMVALEGTFFDDMCREVDLLVSLGGDGTLLSLVRQSYGHDKPVLGINAGNLGFLADIPIDYVNDMVDKLLIGDYRIDERMMIEGYIESGDERKEFYAFNDVVISRPAVSHIIELMPLLIMIGSIPIVGMGLLSQHLQVLQLIVYLLVDLLSIHYQKFLL